MFVIKANTPEAMRNEIVKWLNLQASNHRRACAIAKLAGIKRSELIQAKTYEDAAKFLEGCTVEKTFVCRAPGDPECTIQCDTCRAMEGNRTGINY